MYTDGIHFKDSAGRILLPHGCNLGGDSKYPVTPSGRTSDPASLDRSNIPSFCGRPFPLEESDYYFTLLSSSGFDFIRMVIPWEAIEPSGPGLYDETYLAYLRKIVKKAGEYGFSVLIDPHQDIWSRWCGGDGAPAWTLEAIGIQPENIHQTGAAVLQQEAGDSYVPMIWPSNYFRYATASMFTLFFAGSIYAPSCIIEGQSIQEWLQGHYIAAWRHLYRRIKDCKNIIGFEVMNEPHHGYIGHRDIRKLGHPILKEGPMPNPLQAMAATRRPVPKIPTYHLNSLGMHRTGTSTLNREGKNLFKEGFCCPWEREGLWTIDNDKPIALKPDHFARLNNRPVDFTQDFLKPFSQKFASSMQEARESLLIFIDSVPGNVPPNWSQDDGTNIVNAFHWYDGYTLMRRKHSPHFNINTATLRPVFGLKAQTHSAISQIRTSLDAAHSHMGGVPSFLGEFGIPFNLVNSKAFHSGDYSRQERALRICYEAIDKLLIPHTIWNFSASNTYEDGDGWNTEDLSIWNSQTKAFRAITAWCRPWPLKTAGIPRSVSWNHRTGLFEYHFNADPSCEEPSVISIPTLLTDDEPRFEVYKGHTKITSARIEQDALSSRWLIFLPEISGDVCVKAHINIKKYP